MKKLLLILSLSLTLALSLVACGGDDAPDNTTSGASPSGTTADASPDGTTAGNATDATESATETTDDAATDPADGSPISDFDTDRVIAVNTREEGSGTRDAFISITGVGDDMYAEAVVDESTSGILTKVQSNDYAIGYVSIGSLNDSVKALTIDGVVPSHENVFNGTYGIQRPLLVCVNAEKAQVELVSDFIAFMLSAEGQEIVSTSWTKVDEDAPEYETKSLSGSLKVGGSTSVEPLMQRLRQAYLVHNPNVTIEISGGGSGTGINEATSGVIDIGMSSRALRDNEKEALTPTDIALDGVAVIVNPNNPIEGLTIAQVKLIFTGEITKWSGLE
ncbi:MAG: substrate-binding domain-containing protein [Oscillospiraceae bacterium]|nr:substrate-binding domain-containing protein [Oscillospiraceae bacterium]